MAEEAVVNPCCSAWIVRRNALREAVKLLNQWKDQIEDEKLSISKEEERARVEARDIESAVREELENEILRLKLEMTYLWEIAYSRVTEGEAEINRLKELLEKEKKPEENEARVEESAVRAELENEILQLELEIANLWEIAYSRIKEGEAEINRLTELLGKEKKRGDAETKKAEAEKIKAAEALKLLKAVRVEFENEILQLKSEITSIQDTAYSRGLEITEWEAEVKHLKELLEKEKKCRAAEKKKAEAEKKKAVEALKLLKILETERSKLDGEKLLIDNDLIQKQVADGVAEINRLKELLAKEKKRADSEKKKAEVENKKALVALKITLEALGFEVKRAAIKIEKTQQKLEAQKNKAKKEKKRANSEKTKAEIQKRCAEEENKKLLHEKNRSDELSRRLEEEKKRREEVEKKVQDIMYPEKLEKFFPEGSDRRHETVQLEKDRPRNTQLQKDEFVSAREVENLNMLFLEKQLELEKKHVKHAKKVSKFEKRRNDLLQQEVCRLKQDLLQFCHRLNLCDGCFSHGVEGIDASSKVGIFISPEYLYRRFIQIILFIVSCESDFIKCYLFSYF